MSEIIVSYSIEMPDGVLHTHSAKLIVPGDSKSTQEISKLLGQDPTVFTRNVFALSCLAIAKGITYKDSWKKHGESFSIIPNLLRKMDRITACAENDKAAGKIDGSGDLAVYSMLFLQWLEQEHPEEFKEWLSSEVIKYVNEYAGANLRVGEKA